MQTQRTILWVIFLTSLFFLWDGWQRHNGRPSMFAPAAQAPVTGTPAAPGAAARGDASVPPASTAAATNGAVPGAAAPAAAASKIVRLSNDVIALDIDTLGGEVVRAELLRHLDAEQSDRNTLLFQRDAQRTYVAQSGLIGNPAGQPGFPTHRTPFQPEADGRQLAAGQDAVSLSFTAESGGLQVRKTYTLARGSYEIKVRHDLQNVAQQPLSPSLYMQLTRDSSKPPGESSFYSTYTGPVVYSEADKFQKVDFDKIEKGKAEHTKTANDGWVGIIQHYFVSAWVPPASAPREFYTRKLDANLYSVGLKQKLPDLAPGASASTTASLYVGPQDQRVLEQVAPGLDLTVDYGWLTIIAKPIYWLLQQLHKIVGNWGWAIVALTILIKLAFFPLQAASYRSMARMKQVTPKLQALKERHGEDRVKLNQAMMELYKTEKINPLGGCLPIVVQIPVFISLYWVLLASVEMRNAPWIGWIKDLAAPDPFYILPLVMAGTMIIQTRLNPTPPDPVQARMMQIMPLVFSVMFFFFPAGLVLYWLVNNVFSIAQQWVITKRVESGTDKDTRVGRVAKKR